MKLRGVAIPGAVFVIIFVFIMFYFMFSGGSKSVIEYVGKNYAYRGTFTNEASVEDGIDIFASGLTAEKVRDNIVSYLKPFMPAQLNTKAQYILNYRDCVIVVSSRETFTAPSVKFDEKDNTVIALYPPAAAEKEYNEQGGNTYVHVYPDYNPMYYRRYRNRYVSVHFYPRYRSYYTRRYRGFGYDRSRSYGTRTYSNKGYSSKKSSSFRSGGFSRGK